MAAIRSQPAPSLVHPGAPGSVRVAINLVLLGKGCRAVIVPGRYTLQA